MDILGLESYTNNYDFRQGFHDSICSSLDDMNDDDFSLTVVADHSSWIRRTLFVGYRWMFGFGVGFIDLR